MKTIEDAVMELGGKWPSSSSKCNFLFEGVTGFLYANAASAHDKFVCLRTEFEATAKRMGYVNGYKWGVEYPTNGKRPDLPLDVKVKFSMPVCMAVFSLISQNALYSANGATFVITDERYKPEPEEGPAESAAAFFERRSPTVYGAREPLHDAKPVEPEPKSWYESGELPPVGIECEIGWSGSDSKVWYVGVVTYRSEKYTIIVYGDGSEICYSESELDEVKFRPLRTKREKTIIEACKVMKSTHHTVVSNLALLYDAGLLRLPDSKNKD